MKKITLLVLFSVLIVNLWAQIPIIYKIEIDSEINTTSRIYLNNGLKEARDLDAKAVLLHLNTYGGTLVDADSMRTAILYSDIPVYVFIDNNAASAGALISIACKKIFMRPGGTIGAATVVEGNTGDQAPDKYQSYMRGLMRATAEESGRDPKIAEAMVDDRIVIPGINEEGHVLTLTASEAMKLGYCDGMAESIGDVIEKQLGYEEYEIKEYKPSFYDNLLGFLTNPAFRAILIMIIIAGIYFELQSPGIGFPSLAAIVAALLYFTPAYLGGLVQYWEVIAFVLGIILILLEIFVIPGFGITGIAGIILIILGLVFSTINNEWFSFGQVEMPDLSMSLVTVLGGILLGFILILFLSSRIGKKGIFRTIALDADLKDSESVSQEEFSLVGQTGTTMTDLRPSGKIIIDHEVYDAIAIIGFIEENKTVKVVKFENMQLYVEAI